MGASSRSPNSGSAQFSPGSLATFVFCALFFFWGADKDELTEEKRLAFCTRGGASADREDRQMEWNRLVSPFMEMMVVINSGNGGTILQASHTFRKVTGYGGGGPFLLQDDGQEGAEEEDEDEEEENEQRVVRSSMEPKNRALRRHLLSHVGEDEVPLRVYIVREDWPKMKRVLGVGQPVKAKEGKEAHDEEEEEEDRSRADENENLVSRRAKTDPPCERHHRPTHHHQLQQLLGGDLYSAPREADIEPPRVAGAQQQQQEDEDGEEVVTQTTLTSTPSSTTRSSSSYSSSSTSTPTSSKKMMMTSERDGGGWSRVQCRLVTEGGSQLWIAWTAKRRGHLVFLSGTLVPPQGGGPSGIRRHSLAEQDGQRLARTYLASAAAAASRHHHHLHHHPDMILGTPNQPPSIYSPYLSPTTNQNQNQYNTSKGGGLSWNHPAPFFFYTRGATPAKKSINLFFKIKLCKLFDVFILSF